MGRGRWTREDSEDWYRDQYDEEPLKDEVELTEHQARNDYQDDGEPFGELDGRDRDDNPDVDITDSRYYKEK